VAWPEKFKLNLGMSCGIIVVGFAALTTIVYSQDRWSLFLQMSQMDSVRSYELDRLREGEEVWLDVELVSGVYGCTEVYNDTDEGSWETDSYTNSHLWVELSGEPVRVLLPSECPQGEYETESTPKFRERSYEVGQRLSLLGEVSSTSPLTVSVFEHRGGTPASHQRSVFLFGLILSVCALLSGFIFLAIVWRMFSGIDHRHQWEKFAAARGLQITKKNRWSLGRIRGELQGRVVDMSRHRGVGDGDLLPADVALRVSLNPCMNAFRMKSQVGVERWLPDLQSEVEVGDPLIDPIFLLRGVDAARWKALIEGKGVRERLIELRTRKVALRIHEGWLELCWPRLSTDVMGHVLDKGLELAMCLERAEGRGWEAAAKALGLDFRIDDQGTWTLRNESDSRGWEISYLRRGREWMTEFTFDLSGCIPLGWSLRAQVGTSKGLRTGDPVLDAQVCVSGLDPMQLQGLIHSPQSTQALLSALCGHGLVLQDGQVSLKHRELVVAPLELIEDAILLSELLIGLND